MADGDQVPVAELADAIFGFVKDSVGKRMVKPSDATKAMLQKYGDRCTKESCKEAIRQLTDSGRLIYGYMGGSSSLQIPPTGDAGS
jgi:hypothetical protein